MEDTTQTELSQENKEIAHAQAVLEAARAKRAAAAELNEQQAKAEIAAYRAREEAQIAAAKAKQEELRQKHIDRQKKEAEVEAEKARMEAEHQRGLEAVAAKAEAERQAVQAHNDRLKQLTEAAYMAEQEAKQLVDAALAAAQRANQLREETGVTVNPEDGYFEHPLRRFIAPTDIYAEDKPMVVPVVTAEVKARKSQRYVDIGTSKEIETLIRTELKISPNTQRCDELSSCWEYEALLPAVRKAIEDCKAQPRGHDQFFHLVESTLEAQQ